MRKLYLLAFLCLAAIAGHAQTATQYVFSRTTGTVTDISGLPGTTSTTNISNDDVVQTGISIGFTFHYCGVDYTQLSACSNGFISLANSTATPFGNSTGNLATVASGQGFLAPWWDDLDGSGRTAYFRTEGTAPTRVFIFQWGSNATPWSRLSGGRLLMFQVKLYESSNVVQYCYGNQSGTGTASVTIGIASSSTNYQTLPTLTSTTTTTGFTTNLNGMPAVNTIMEWTPPPTIAVTPASMTFATAVSTNSGSQNATVRAWGLTSGIVTVTAPANYEVFDGSTWVTSMNVPVTAAGAGTYINSTVPVRFSAPGVAGPYNGNLDFTSTGATTRTIILNGTAQPICSSTPTPGTVSASVTTGSCTPYGSNLSLTGATTGLAGLNYQWQTSPDGVAAYTDVAGATNSTYSATIGSSIYYRARVGCSNTGTSDFTPGQSFIYNAPPAAISASSSSVCIAGTATMTNTTPGGTWSSSNNSVVTVGSSSGIASGITQGTATLSYIVTATSCYATTVISVNPTPSAITITPASSQTVCLGSGAVFTASATTTVPVVTLTENDFNSSISPWTVDNTGSNGGTSPASSQWLLRPSGYSAAGQTHTPPGGTQFIVAVSDAAGSSSATKTRLTSPIFSLVGYASATLTFQHYYRYITSDTNANVEISTNGGSSWTTLIDYRSGGVSVGSASSFASASLDLTPYVGEANCQIRFYYNAAWGWSWALDNVKLTAVPPPTYTWSGVSGATGLSCTSCANPTITPTALGTNTYSVTATAEGCSTTTTVSVSVNPLPAAIGGTLQVCEGLSTTLTNTDGGATWSSTNTGVATIGSSSGVVSGNTAGTSTISYTFNSTGCARTVVFTVNPLPATIGGATAVCVGSTGTLTNADAGGTWASANTSVTTVGASDGLHTGIASGTTHVTYTLPTGCVRTAIVTANPVPVASVTPTSPVTICIGDATSAFTASASNPGLVLLNQDFNGTLGEWTVQVPGPSADQWTIVPTGFDGTSGDGSSMLQASPLNAGSALVQTMLVSPSFSTVGFSAATLTFNHYLIADPGETVLVEYSTDGGTMWQPLADYASSGLSGAMTWSAASPDVTLALPLDAINQPNVRLRWNYLATFYAWFLDNIKVTATAPAATYSWTGGSELSCTTCANPTITPTATGANVYTVTATGMGSCSSTATATVSVNALPDAITGVAAVCEGLTTTLASATGGGTWTSSNTAVGTVDASSGDVTGIVAGTTTITYTVPTGCYRTVEVTVNALPANIGGTLQVCEGLTTTLTNTTVGGTWTSSNTMVADIDLNSGVASGHVAGTSTVTYTNSTTGCIRTAMLTVNPLPAAIGGTLAVCEGLSTTLTNADAGGTWTSANTTTATIGSSSGVTTGGTTGMVMITYTLPTGCITSSELTVNALPAAIGGTLVACEGLSTTLSNSTPGGTWTSGTTAVASIDGSGVVTANTAGTSTITYTITATGCINTAVYTVNALPDMIGGTLDVCEGLTTTLTNSTAGGTWASDNMTIATIDANTGVATGVSAGTANITYEITATGCQRAAELTVNALPAAIAGSLQVCEASTTTLTNADAGGTWSTSDISLATVGASTGVVSGVSAGNPMVTYMLPTGCISTATLTVDALPAMITGTQDVCEGLNTTLASATSGGLWTSASTAIATVVTSTGVVTGVTAGVVDITYTIPTTCYRVASVTVNALPAVISGATQVCEASMVTLTNADAGGTWSSSDLATATAGSATGEVTGVNSGTVMVTYTLPTGCIRTHDMTVNALPVVYNVTGGGSYCAGGSGVAIGVSNTESGTTYNLYLGSSFMNSITGTGTAAGFASMTAAGTYTVQAVSPASCVRAMSGDATVVIIPLVTPSVTLGSSPDDTVCAGVSTTFNATASNAGTTPTYTWEVNGSSVTTTGSSHTYEPADGDVITVTVTSSEACPSPASVSTSQTMVVVSNETPVASIAAQMGTQVLTSADTICQGSMVTYTATSVFGGTSPAYTWYKNGASTGAMGDTYIYAPAKGDRIYARLNSNYRCPVVNNVSSDTIAVNVDSVYIPVVNIAINTKLTVKPGTPVTFTATVIEGGPKPTFQWYKNSALINGATSNVYTASAIVDNDSFSVVVYGTGDCSYYTNNAVRIRIANDVDDVMLGSDLRMMPNPTSGEFVISGTLATTDNKDVAIEVIDMLGQVVYKGSAIAKMGQLNERVKLSNNLANGMYMLNVRTGDESKVFHFVLKQ